MNKERKINAIENLEAYLKMTGQTFQYLMSGAIQYGPKFIDELVEKALSKNKKIVWKTKLIEGQELGMIDYYLKPMSKRSNPNTKKK